MLVVYYCYIQSAHRQREEEVLRAVEDMSTSQQATMQRTVSQPPESDSLNERLVSFLRQLTSTAAPATSNPSSEPVLASTISSNTLRRDSSTISVGRRPAPSTAGMMMLQQVRDDTCSDDVATIHQPQMINLGAVPREADSEQANVPASASASKEVAARLHSLISPRRASAKQPGGAQEPPQPRYGQNGTVLHRKIYIGRALQASASRNRHG